MNIISNLNTNEVALLFYSVAINIISFLTFGLDKAKAKNNSWRISESTLIILAIIGGSSGALMGMIVFKHKTNKVKFSIGIPLLFIMHKVLELYIFNSLK